MRGGEGWLMEPIRKLYLFSFSDDAKTSYEIGVHEFSHTRMCSIFCIHLLTARKEYEVVVHGT